MWWKCSEGHEWESKILNRKKGHNCPYCSNQKILEGYNDLATINPYLAKEWNYSKNKKLLPTQISPKSGKKVWWKCNEGHEWEATPHYRSYNSKCPKCNKTNK